MPGTKCLRPRMRSGFSIIDLLVTIVIMGIVTSAAFGAVIAYTRAFQVQRGRVVAQMLAHNEAEVLRTAGPSVGIGTDTVRVDETFAPNSRGDYTIVTQRGVQCSGGETVHYNGEASDPITGCPNNRPMLVATVTVSYPTDDRHTGSLVISTAVGPTTLPVPRLYLTTVDHGTGGQ